MNPARSAGDLGEGPRGRKAAPLLRLAALAIAAIGIHGYHLGTDDGAVYLPAILKAVHPQLYPYGAEFFESHATLSIFTALVAGSLRLARIDPAWMIFGWHLLTTFLFLVGAWQVASTCFRSNHARWSALLLVAALLTIPAGGTALVLMDPYLTARSVSTPLALFAIAAALRGRGWGTVCWVVLTALVHPLMAAIVAAAALFIALPSSWTDRIFGHQAQAGAAALLPSGFYSSASPEYREVLDMRPFLWVTQWTWYEWVGIVAPLAFFFAGGALRQRQATAAFPKLAGALTLLGMMATALAVIFASSTRLEGFLRLQPMRAFHLIYIVFFLSLGGLLGEYASRLQYRWLLAFIAFVAASMFLIQRNQYAHSVHIEWPWSGESRNPWVEAFLWVRDNTPESAVFAIDPQYIFLQGEDLHGFRGIAQRSVLTDRFKDSGVVSLFPKLAPQWGREQRSLEGWTRFGERDFQALARQYPVSWVVLQMPSPPGLDCPFHNGQVAVCHIPGTR